MKVHKIDDVKFSLDGSEELQNLDRQGELHISVKGVIIREGESLFEVPFGSLKSVMVARKNPLRLRLGSDLFILELEGTRAERIWALRALILPLINGGNTPKPGLKTLLVLLCTRVKDRKLLANIMGLDKSGLEELFIDARLRGYLTEENKVTEEAMELFSDNEQQMVRTLGGIKI